MDEQDIETVRELKELGWSLQKIAEHFVITKAYVAKICSTSSKIVKERPPLKPKRSKYDYLFEEKKCKGMNYKEYIRKQDGF